MANTPSPMKLGSSVAPPHSSAQGSGGCGGSMSNQQVGGETIPPALPLPMKTTPTRLVTKLLLIKMRIKKNKIPPKPGPKVPTHTFPHKNTTPFQFSFSSCGSPSSHGAAARLLPPRVCDEH